MSRSRVCGGGLMLADPKDGLRHALSADECKQVRELKKRNRLLEQEAEAMRRAVAYLSRDVNPKRCTRWYAS